MGSIIKLFSSGKKKSSPAPKKNVSKPAQTVFFEQHFTQSHTFKGYKRFRVSYYGYEPAEKGLAKFRKMGYPLEGADIMLQGVRRSGHKFIEVYVSDCLLGSTPSWNDGYKYLKDTLLAGKAEKVHLKIESEAVISQNGRGKIESEDRDIVYLFVKAPDLGEKVI